MAWKKWLAIGLVAMGVATAGGVAATWAPDLPVAELKAKYATAPSQFIDIEGLQVHVRDEGAKDSALTPLLLIHGTGDSLFTWDGWVRELTAPGNPPRRIVRMDLPAFGLTGPNAGNDYSFEVYVRFITKVMDKLGIQKAVLAGNSLGGHIAWRVASDAPQRVERLILVDATGYRLKPESVPLGFILASLPGAEYLMPYTLPRGMVEGSLKNVYGDPSRVKPETVDLFYDMTRREGNRKALVRRLQQGYNDDAAKIAALKVPTLLIWGRKDRLVPLATSGERFAKDIAGSQLVVFDDLGHVPHEEGPVPTAAAVRDFLAKP
jgi:pimeloyl-ACP methyl ester carboxylesterase